MQHDDNPDSNDSMGTPRSFSTPAQHNRTFFSKSWSITDINSNAFSRYDKTYRKVDNLHKNPLTCFKQALTKNSNKDQHTVVKENIPPIRK